MPTRMEKVAEDVALAAIRNASTLPRRRSSQLRNYKKASAQHGPTGESRTPINDAMNAVVNATTAGVR